MSEETANRRIINVRVTNNNDEGYDDFFHGKNYIFAGCGKTTSIPLDAATHIFGYTVKDSDEKSMFDHVCKRWGWNTPENVKSGFEDVKKIWAKFTFTPVAVRMTEVPVIDTSALAEDRDEAAQEGDSDFTVPNLKLGDKTIAA